MGETTGDNKEVKTEAVKSELPAVKSQSTLSHSDDKDTVADKFEFIDGVAAFHATAVRKAQERQTLVSNVGPHRRALCARRDLAVRRALCKVDKVTSSSAAFDCFMILQWTSVYQTVAHSNNI